MKGLYQNQSFTSAKYFARSLRVTFLRHRILRIALPVAVLIAAAVPLGCFAINQIFDNSGSYATANVATKADTTYVLSYDANGGLDAPIQQLCDSNEGFCLFTLSSEHPTRPGYNFLGWSTDSSATQPSYQPGDQYVLSDPYTMVTFYAVWAKQSSTTTYTLFYHANGGTNAPGPQFGESTSGSYTMNLSSAVPTRAGHRFIGWSTSQSSTSAQYQPGGTYTMSTTTATLFAVWQSNPAPDPAPEPLALSDYTIVYDANGGSGAPEPQSCRSSNGVCDFTLSTTRPTRANYNFIGWAKDPASSIASYGAGETVSFAEPNTTLYAVWGQTPEPVSTGELTWKQGKDHTIGSRENAIFTIDYPIEEFTSLSVDNQPITRDKDYTAASSINTVTNGKNTTFTLNGTYLDKLKAGSHDLSATFKNGRNVATKFNVINAANPASSSAPPAAANITNTTGTPETGAEPSDTGASPLEIALITIIAATLAVGAFAIVRIVRRDQDEMDYYTYQGSNHI